MKKNPKFIKIGWVGLKLRKIPGIALLLFLTVNLPISLAQSQEGKDPCKDSSMLATKACLQKQFLKADQKLNAVYKDLLACLHYPDGKEKLRKSQRAWLVFREAQAEYEANFYKGGSGEGAIHTQCLLRMTLDRIKELEALKDL